MDTLAPTLLARRNWRSANGLSSEAPAVWLGLMSIATHPSAWAQSRSKQVSAAMVLMLHAAVIALVMASHSIVPTNGQPGLIAFNVSAAAEREPQPRPLPRLHRHVSATLRATPAPSLKVTPVDFTPVQSDAEAIANAQSQDMPAPEEGGCDLTGRVQDALRNSDEVRQQLPEVPVDQRSVANAIMVWNAGWINGNSAPVQAAFSTIRQTISRMVMVSSADCRNQLQRGPRLLYLAGSSGKTMVLALGSGEWTWQQLVAGAHPLPAGAADGLIAPQPPTRNAAMRTADLPARPLLPAPPMVAPENPAPGLSALLASLVRKRSSEGSPYNP